MTREQLIERLHSVIRVNGHIITVAPGSGMNAKFSMQGNVDVLLALNAGKFRQMGQSAFSAYFSYSDSNAIVKDLAVNELLPISNGYPILYGINMHDPKRSLYDQLKEIKDAGFVGVVNYPCIALINGKFRDALEEAGLGYENEIEGIRLAHFLGLFTAAYVTNEQQALNMVRAGVDMISLHFGITGGGTVGAGRVMSLEMAQEIARQIFEKVHRENPYVIRTICGGPVQTPLDTYEFYKNSLCQGAFLGSAVERIPVERAVLNTIKAFRSNGDFNEKNIVTKVLNGTEENLDYVRFMTEYIHANYDKVIRLKDLSVIAHMSISRLSVIFKEKMGTSFTEYLISYRMEKAKELLRTTDLSVKNIASMTGYDDYSQFVKMFRKIVKCTPLSYRENSGE